MASCRSSVATDCAAYRRQLTTDTKSCRTEMLGDLTANYNGIPRSYYRFGASESPLPNFPRDDRLEPRAIDNNKAPLLPTNDSARGEFD